VVGHEDQAFELAFGGVVGDVAPGAVFDAERLVGDGAVAFEVGEGDGAFSAVKATMMPERVSTLTGMPCSRARRVSTTVRRTMGSLLTRSGSIFLSCST